MRLQDAAIGRLSWEIRRFLKFLAPLPLETQLRSQTEKLMKQYFSRAMRKGPLDREVRAFGSSVTGLSLPSSDIDLTVMPLPGQKRKPEGPKIFKMISSELRRKPWISFVLSLPRARVQIIKVTHKYTGLKFDISLGKKAMSALTTAEDTKQWIEELPVLKDLTILCKQYLNEQEMNVVVEGGLGGFATTCLVYNFLCVTMKEQNLTPKDIGNVPIGKLLLDFFQYYGNTFNPKTQKISFQDMRPYVAVRSGEVEDRNIELIVEDPRDKANIITKQVTKFKYTRKKFADSYSSLKHQLSLTVPEKFGGEPKAAENKTSTTENNNGSNDDPLENEITVTESKGRDMTFVSIPKSHFLKHVISTRRRVILHKQGEPVRDGKAECQLHNMKKKKKQPQKKKKEIFTVTALEREIKLENTQSLTT